MSVNVSQAFTCNMLKNLTSLFESALILKAASLVHYYWSRLPEWHRLACGKVSRVPALDLRHRCQLEKKQQGHRRRCTQTRHPLVCIQSHLASDALDSDVSELCDCQWTTWAPQKRTRSGSGSIAPCRIHSTRLRPGSVRRASQLICYYSRASRCALNLAACKQKLDKLDEAVALHPVSSSFYIAALVSRARCRC